MTLPIVMLFNKMFMQRPKLKYVEAAARWHQVLIIPRDITVEQTTQLLSCIVVPSNLNNPQYSAALPYPSPPRYMQILLDGVICKAPKSAIPSEVGLFYTFTKIEYNGTCKMVRALIDLHVLSLQC